MITNLSFRNYDCYHVYRRTFVRLCSCTAFLDTSYVRRLPNQAMQGFPIPSPRASVHSVRAESKSNGYNEKDFVHLIWLFCALVLEQNQLALSIDLCEEITRCQPINHRRGTHLVVEEHDTIFDKGGSRSTDRGELMPVM
jgi:hypothetical protein